MKPVFSQSLFKGSFLSLRRDTYKLGQVLMDRDIVEHADAAVILPFVYPNQLYLIKQYRYGVQDFLIEAPAGSLELGETPEQAAYRELKEETGFLSSSLVSLGKAYSMPGCCTECLHFFIALDLKSGPTSFDQDENIELMSYTIDEVQILMQKGIIQDSKTLLSLFYLFNFLKDKK
jgi:ADP-ribose pyrophosphatase